MLVVIHVAVICFCCRRSSRKGKAAGGFDPPGDHLVETRFGPQDDIAGDSEYTQTVTSRLRRGTARITNWVSASYFRMSEYFRNRPEEPYDPNYLPPLNGQEATGFGDYTSEDHYSSKLNGNYLEMERGASYRDTDRGGQSYYDRDRTLRQPTIRDYPYGDTKASVEALRAPKTRVTELFNEEDIDRLLYEEGQLASQPPAIEPGVVEESNVLPTTFFQQGKRPKPNYKRVSMTAGMNRDYEKELN